MLATNHHLFLQNSVSQENPDLPQTPSYRLRSKSLRFPNATSITQRVLSAIHDWTPMCSLGRSWGGLAR